MPAASFKIDGSALLDLRTEEGWTQKQLAEKIDVKIKQIHMWESEKIGISRKNLNKLCAAFNVFENELLDDYSKSTLRAHKLNIRRKNREIINKEADVSIETSMKVINQLGEVTSVTAQPELEPTPAEAQCAKWSKDNED